MTTTEDGKAMTDGDFTKLLSAIRALSDAHLDKVLTASTEEKAARKQRLQEETMAKIRALAGDAELVVPIIKRQGRTSRSKRRRSSRSASAA